MAKVYKAPEGYEAPQISYGPNYDREAEAKQEADYIERLAALCREQGDSPLLGEVVRFQHADGYAQYMVCSTKPLAFIHLELGDAWQIPDAHMRGLRVSDVQEQVRRAKSLAKLFADRAA